MNAWIRVLLVLVLAWLAASCSKFSYVGMELDVHYDGDTDKLVMLEVERGIYAGSPSKLGDAITALDRAANGGRVIPPDDLFSIDFDKLEESLTKEPSQEAKPHERDLAEFARGVKVVKSGTFLDADGRLSLFRMWSISNFKKLIAFTNDGLNDALIDAGASDEPFKPAFPVFDVETRDLQRAKAKARAPWLSADKNSIVLDVPMTPNCAARCLAYLLGDKPKEDPPTLVSPWKQISSLEIKDNRALLRFAPTDGEWMHFEWSWPVENYNQYMLNNLKENKSFLDESATLKQIREMMKAR
jgi:hypothetical protein